MKAAIVGFGSMGQANANAYSEIDGVEIVGIVENRLSAVHHAKQSGYQVYESLDQLVAEVKPEVVNICLPTHLHKEAVMQAANAGIHVICETPLAHSLTDAEQMIASCKNNGVRLFVSHPLRFYPQFRDMSQKIKAGAIGIVGVVNGKQATVHPSLDKPWIHEWNSKISGGFIVTEMLFHHIDFVHDLIGDVNTVYGMRRHSLNVELALVTLKFKSGAIVNLEGIWGPPGLEEEFYEIAGRDGTIRNDNYASISLRMHTLPRGVQQSSPIQDPVTRQLEHLLDCLRTDKEPLVSTDDSLRALQLALMAMESATDGTPLQWAPLKS